MDEWWKVVGLGVFIVGVIVVLDKFSGITGHAISSSLGDVASPIVGMIAIFIGIFLMFIRRHV